MMQVYRSLEPAEEFLSFSIQRCGIELRGPESVGRRYSKKAVIIFAPNSSESAQIKVHEISPKIFF
jgi:hypothetical protein